MIPDNRGDWAYTSLAIDHAKRSGHYSQERDSEGRLVELYQGRHIISRDTPINKGVYFIDSDEAVVVDDVNDSSLIPTYQAVLAQIEQIKREGKEPKHHMLDIVWRTVLRVMPYDHGDVRVDEVKNRVGVGRKTYLGSFMGAGVCRHQSLLAAYLLEKLVSQGYLSGKVSVDRNMNLSRTEGHAWARYTNSRGVVFILDAAQHHLGKLTVDAPHLSPYARPEDITRLGIPEQKNQLNYRSLSNERKDPVRNRFFTQFQSLLRKIFLPHMSPKINAQSSIS